MEQSVQAFFKLYLARSDLRPASVDIKQRACNYFVEWFGDLPVGEVKPETASDYRKMLGKGRSKVSVNGYLNNFRAFWTWLRKHGYIQADPFAFVGPITVDEQPPRATFTAAELGQMMKVATDIEQIQVCLGLLGCRRGEMQAIQIRNVKLDEEPAHIILAHREAGKRTLPWGTKSHKSRYVPVPTAMAFDGRIVAFRKLVADRIAELGSDPEAYLCIRPEHIKLRLGREKGWTWNDLKDLDGNHPRSFKRLQERAGIRQPKRFHELRAAFTTAMLDNMEISRVAELVGHASVNQTAKYDRKAKLSLVAEAANVASKAYLTKVG